MNFAADGGKGERECAFYNLRVKSLQRNFGKYPVTLDSDEAFDLALGSGATAFYCSYWRYPDKDFSRPLGRDLVWTVRAGGGGLGFAKEVTAHVIEALVDGITFEPWVKYSGQLGFDLLIPLEAIPDEAWVGNSDAAVGFQAGMTSHIASYLGEHFSGVQVCGTSSPLEIKRGTKTCLLSELRVRRGLLLAPMSLCQESGLVSVPIDPSRVMEFSVFDASPADARAFEWVPPLRGVGWVESTLPWKLIPVQTKFATACDTSFKISNG